MPKKKMHKYSTILDIADKVGLSHMTVSRVLSGKGGVREATRQRVLKAAEKLNYSPNSLANGFRSGKTQSAGIVWQFVDPWMGDTAVGLWVMQALQRHGLATYQSQYSPDLAEMIGVLDDLLRRRVDAIVIGGMPELLSQPDIARRLEKIPAVVAVSYSATEGFRGDQVIHDRNAAIRQVVRHLAAIGRKRPAMLLSLEMEANLDKLRAFKGAMAEFGIADHPRVLIEMGRTPMTLSQPFNSDIDRYVAALNQAWPVGTPIDVDAIFSFNDLGAMVTAKFLRERGVKVGEEVAVIGFNDDPAAGQWDPPLASGDRCRSALAEATQDMVLTRLANPELPPRQQTIEMKFVWRESAGGKGEGRPVG
jgi:LacI family transcriptional regulator